MSVNTVDYTSRFAAKKDCHPKLDNYIIPDEWWSRKAEYPWAAQFVQAGDTVIDAACGVTHFFKYWLAEHAARVLAIDSKPALLKCVTPGNMTMHCSDITHMPEITTLADVTYCISVLEHIPTWDKQLCVMKELRRVTKPNGLLVVTLDVPNISVCDYQRLVTTAKLTFAGAVDTLEPADVLVNTQKKLKVFMSVLRKPL